MKKRNENILLKFKYYKQLSSLDDILPSKRVINIYFYFLSHGTFSDVNAIYNKVKKLCKFISCYTYSTYYCLFDILYIALRVKV